MEFVQPTVDYPPGCPLDKLDRITEYMQRRYHSLIHPSTPPAPVIPDIQIPLPVICEADRILSLVVEAYKNTCTFAFIP